MNVLLWTLVVVGAWNLINLIARIFYEEPSYFYIWHIVLGFWAAFLLIW